MKYPLEPRGELAVCLCRGSALLEKEKPFSKELSDCAVPAHVSSSSSWPLIPVSRGLIDCFDRCKAESRLDLQCSALSVVYCAALKLGWRFSKEIGVWKVMTLLIFMSYASGTDLLHSSLERCRSLSGGWTIPQPWNRSRSDWRRPWASWPMSALSAHGRGVQTSWFLRCLPTQAFLRLYNSEAGVWTGQKFGSRRSSGLAKTQCGTALQNGGTGSPPSPSLVPRESRAGAPIWWRVWC